MSRQSGSTNSQDVVHLKPQASIVLESPENSYSYHSLQLTNVPTPTRDPFELITSTLYPEVGCRAGRGGSQFCSSLNAQEIEYSHPQDGMVAPVHNSLNHNLFAYPDLTHPDLAHPQPTPTDLIHLDLAHPA